MHLLNLVPKPEEFYGKGLEEDQLESHKALFVRRPFLWLSYSSSYLFISLLSNPRTAQLPVKARVLIFPTLLLRVETVRWLQWAMGHNSFIVTRSVTFMHEFVFPARPGHRLLGKL